ncbi:MAG: right-handed parallel beta-helix repeat-containing protein [Deltaproteobacteria bacterium]|nr:right-handed parallel beta-helix repeat-containing protein [Deltaproteobacteria bacterium]
MRKHLLWSILTCGAVALGWHPMALAAEIRVDSTDVVVRSDKHCSLSEAILAANTDAAVDTCTAGSGDDVIELDANAIYTITAPHQTTDTGLPPITSSLTIHGDHTLIVRSSQIEFRIAKISGAVKVLFDGLLLQGGRLSRGGAEGGILRIDGDAQVTIRQTKLFHGTAGIGGALYASGAQTEVRLENSGIASSSATVDGGGIASSAKLLHIEHSDIETNKASQSGGGIWFSRQDGTLEIEDARIANNKAVQGGGLYVDNGAALSMKAISIVENTATSATQGGGGLFLAGLRVAEIVNTTFASNVALSDGSAIFLAGHTKVTLGHCALVKNRGGSAQALQLGSDMGGKFTAVGSIFYLNGSLNLKTADPCSAVTSKGWNIVETTCRVKQETPDNVDIVTDQPKLSDLVTAQDGMHTYTILMTGSPGINNGDAASCSSTPALQNDQLGHARDDLCDIGPVEAGCGDTVIQSELGETCDGLHVAAGETCGATCQTVVTGATPEDETGDGLDTVETGENSGEANAMQPDATQPPAEMLPEGGIDTGVEETPAPFATATIEEEGTAPALGEGENAEAPPAPNASGGGCTLRSL